MRKKNDAGFTLIELVVTIVCCSIVTLAVMTVLLTGTRIGRAAEKSSGEQQTVRIVLTALESMISDGAVTEIRFIGDDWALLGKGEDDSSIELLRYSGGQGALLTSGGTPLLEGLTNATAELSTAKLSGDSNDEDPDAIKNLLTVTVYVDDVAYPTSVYCRVAPKIEGEDLKLDDTISGALPDSSSEATYAARKAFLSKAASQYGSDGSIYDENGQPTGQSFSSWYDPSWDKDTPWCMTFLSWVAEQNSDCLMVVPHFAHVDKCMAAFKDETRDTWKEKTDTPTPGDFVFFDWEQDNDPDHVGVVLAVETDTNGNAVGIYTIEGNSGGKVAVRYYSAGSASIVGYGVLNWNTAS